MTTQDERRETVREREKRAAKIRGYNQAVMRLRDIAPFAEDPAQVEAAANLLAAVDPA